MQSHWSDEFYEGEFYDPMIRDGGLAPESEGQTKYKEEEETPNKSSPIAVHQDHLGSSRSPDNEKCKDPAAIIHDVFGDSDDDEPLENEVRTQTNEKKKDKGKYAEKLGARNAAPDEDETYHHDEECTDHKGKGVAPMEVFEIPLRAPPVHPNQIATIRLSNLIGIDPKPFDPATYVDEEIYVTDSSGSKMCVPPSNIIRFREVKNPDGTTSFESNARFVEWSDGSLQLLIGNEAFDVSEQDARDIQSHLFLRHGKEIYQSQGRITRKMKFMPSSLSSNSHNLLTAMVDSRHKKVNKVQRYISEEDPEHMIVQNEKVETQILKASKQLSEKKKKVTNRYRPKGRKERELTPSFLEDSADEDNEPPSASTLCRFNQDMKMEAAAEKRIMNAKMKPKDTRRSAISNVGLKMGTLNISKEGKADVDDELEGSEVANTISRNKIEEMEGEEEEPYEGSEQPTGKSAKSGSKLRKQLIESDEDTPPRKTATRRHKTIIYDSSDE